MRIWFFFDPGDAPAVRALLNRHAAEGWELAEEQDCACYFARLERTGRGELSYDAAPASPFRPAEELEHQVRLRAAEGWESVATLNGMDFYRAAPLRFPEAHPIRPKPSVLAQRWLPGWLGLGAAVLLSLWLLLTGEGTWYLSNARIFLRFTGIPAALGAAYTLAWQLSLLLGRDPAKGTLRGAYLRGALKLLGGVWFFLLCVAAVLDYVRWPMALLVTLVWAAAALSASGLWRRRSYGLFRQVAALITGIALLSAAALSLVYPVQQEADILESGERSRYSVVSLEDLTDAEGEFLSGSWETSGSLLVTRAACEEWWLVDGERVKVSGEAYTCRLGTAGLVAGSLSGAVAVNGETVVRASATLDVPSDVLTQAAEAAVSAAS